jgi:carbon monoxide dehydrogenase subunit G
LAIRLEKKYILDISQQNVWEAILDPETLAEILPNCKSLDPIGDHKFNANIEIKIGPIKGQFKSKLSLFDLDPPNGYKFDVNGDGSKGQMRGAGEILLTTQDGRTEFIFIATGSVSGIIARVGQRLIEATGKRLMDQGFENFKKRIMSTQAA